MPYPSYPAAYPYPYGPTPMPRRATFSSILGAMFDVWSKNFLNFFVVFLLLSLVTGTLGALLSFAVFRTFEPGGGFVPGSGSASAAIAVILGLFVALVVGGVVAIFVYISLSLYPPAIMMENERAIGGLSRSWAITKGYRWSLFGAIIIALILVALITTAILVPAGFFRHPAATIVASAIASGIVGSWLLIVAAVAYDLIVRSPTSVYGTPPPYAPGFGIGPPPGVGTAPPGPPQAPPPAAP